LITESAHGTKKKSELVESQYWPSPMGAPVGGKLAPRYAVSPAETFEGIHAIDHFCAGDLAGAREWVARHRDIGGIDYMALETCFGDITKEEVLQPSGTPGHRGGAALRLIPRPPALASQMETSTQDDARALQTPQV
jgi:hypothetical protein